MKTSAAIEQMVLKAMKIEAKTFSAVSLTQSCSACVVDGAVAVVVVGPDDITVVLISISLL